MLPVPFADRPSPPEYLVTASSASPPEETDLYFHVGVIQRIMAATPDELRVETGGLLMGLPGEDEQGAFLLVEEALASAHAQGTSTSLTFTSAAWQELDEARERNCPHAQVVGWYHTHPGLGVFLSPHDLFIHEHFFANPYQVALVYDPVRFRWGVFRWEGSSLVSVPALHLYTESHTASRDLAQDLREMVPQWIIGEVGSE